MGYKTYTCPIAKSCGGCELLAVPYEIQLKRKARMVHETFAQIIDEEKLGALLRALVGMDEPKAYRYKAATPFAPGKRGRVRSGFYRAGTHKLVFANECLVEAPGARAILNDVARVAGDLHISAYQEDAGKGSLRHAVVRISYTTGEAMLTLVTNGEHLAHEQDFIKRMRALHPEIVSINQNINILRTNAILGRDTRLLWGKPALTDALLDCSFEILPTSFYQTNPAQTEHLYALALTYALANLDNAETLEQALIDAGERHVIPASDAHLCVLDAYCGCGTIGISLAAHASNVEVVGVEKVGSAISAAKRNAEINGVSNRCHFVREDATRWMIHEAKQSDAHFDVVIMDPPRAGSTAEFLSACVRLNPERIVYVSCNVLTQARDIDYLQKRGYKLVSLTPVDMFPHTKHVETVCLLSRAI